MTVAWFLERLAHFGDAQALVHKEQAWTYRQVLGAVEARRAALDVKPGEVVLLDADFSLDGVATLLALAERKAIIAPLVPSSRVESGPLVELCEASSVITVDPPSITHISRVSTQKHYETLRAANTAGLVIFTSGSSGLPKGVVHDLGRLLEKFQQPRTAARTLSFLLFDHIGGLNTLFQTLANGGTLVIPSSHDAEVVAAAVERHRVELLPVSPSFLNLLVLNGAHTRHDLSSLKIISYGTEPMPPSTLHRTAEALPGVRLHQLYGLSEIGILQSRVRDGSDVWLQLGGPGVQTRVVDGILQLKAPTAMLGYLNAPDPFTSDGWLSTGDEVDVDGEWLRIKGRRSDMINVGGQKVFPAEVEDVIARMDNISDVAVFGEAHAMMGHVVACRVNLVRDEDHAALRARLRKFCREHLAAYKIPARVDVTTEKLVGARHKKLRG